MAERAAVVAIATCLRYANPRPPPASRFLRQQSRHNPSIEGRRTLRRMKPLLVRLLRHLRHRPPTFAEFVYPF